MPTYIENDASLPTEYHYKFGFDLGPLSFLTMWEYNWTDIKYSEERLDFKDIKLAFSNRGDNQMIRVDLPVIKSLEITAFQTSNSWFSPHSDVEFFFRKFDVKIHSGLELLETGYLKPDITEMQINFGAS
jgi:hypothetical protein